MSFLDYDKADFMRAVRQQVNVSVGEDDTLSGTWSGIGPYTCHFCFILSEPNEIIFLMSCPDMSVPEHKVDSAVRLFKDLEGNVISNAKNENYTIFNHEIDYNSQFGIVFGTSIPMYELSENSADEYIKFSINVGLSIFQDAVPYFNNNVVRANNVQDSNKAVEDMVEDMAYRIGYALGEKAVSALGSWLFGDDSKKK